jgi:flavin-dependent dehydrogenase
METNYDVLICGGGLAGLTLARQLKLEIPELSVAIIDRLARPLPEAAHKVGESSVELSTYYFGKVLHLESYFKQRHLPKLGLRYFFGDAYGAFEDRPELGPSLFPPMPSYQIDRGRLENDLRQIVADMGVKMFEAMIIDGIVLADGTEPHTVGCRQRDNAEQYTLCGHWVVDASGRRRLLQSKLGLTLPNNHSASAAWWRINARLDVEEMGAKGGRCWQRRIVEDRYLSTNHLMGVGYWVWLIPLSSGATSVGIVTDETIHPLRTYGKSYSHAQQWLREHEPVLWKLIKDREPLDFHGLKNFSYHSRQIFSHRRWSCVGEAGIFLDPFYSPGSDFIAMENTITVEMIRRECRGELTEAAVDEFNRLVLDLIAPIYLAYYEGTYCTFGHTHICAAKLIWDLVVFYGILAQLFFQGIILHPLPEVFALMSRCKALNERLQRLFIDWAQTAPPRTPFTHADYTRMRFIQLLHLDMAARRNTEQCLEMMRKNLNCMEELAQTLFWQAVEECLPEHMPKNRRSLPWVNAWGISLSPDQWEVDGLYAPPTAPRRSRSMRGTFAGIFAPMTWPEVLQHHLPYWPMNFARGKLAYAVFRFNYNLFHDKPAMRLRRRFIVDYPSTPRTADSPFGQ